MSFKFVITDNMKQAPNSPEAEEITIKNNNSATCLAIPRNFKNAGYNYIVAYLKNSPIAYALTMTPCQTFPQALSEFWYTCSIAKTGQGSTFISATIANGRSISISSEQIRLYLRLPEGPYVDTQRPTLCRREVLDYIRYPDGPDKSAKRVKMNAFWSYFFGIIIWCMGHKYGSLDQCNNYELQIGHALIFGRNIDFASLIYTELREKIEKKKKEKNVPFPRFLSLIFEGILGEDYENLEEFDAGDIFVGNRMFQKKIEKPHQGLSPSMLAAIPSDELLDSDADTQQPGDQPLASTSKNSGNINQSMVLQ